MSANRQQVRLVAAAQQFYAGRRLFAGDEFTASAEEADTLCALNFARRAKPTVALLSAKPSPLKRRYQRRDMRAEK